jgi:hypothetical protein
MKRINLTKVMLSLAVASLLPLTSVALHAQTTDTAKAKPIEAELVIQSSAELSAELGKKWGRVLSEGYGVSAQGLKMFVDGYASYPQDVLKSALNAKNFETMNRTLMDHNQTLVNALAEKINNEEGTTDVEGHKVKSEVRKALGDEARDLVFIPIAPCRTFDTRTSIFVGYAGVVAPGGPKNASAFWASPAPSNWTPEGGTVANCPDTTYTGPLAGVNPFAVAMNVTVITPAGSGWVTTYRADLPDPSATVVGKFVQNGVTDTALLITNVCRGVTGASCPADIKIASRGTTAHVAGDVVGYFIKPQATALQCETVAMVTPAAAVGLQSATAACSVGFTVTGGSCDTNNSAAKPITASALSGNGWRCETNNYPGNTTVTGFSGAARCCRTPGR